MLASLTEVDAEKRTESTLDLGCWRDTASRAIPQLEGTMKELRGDYRSRPEAIKKCGEAAKKRGFSLYAVQNGGWCAAASYTLEQALSPNAAYRKYGKATHCRNGKGAAYANNVYFSLPAETEPEQKRELALRRERPSYALLTDAGTF